MNKFLTIIVSIIFLSFFGYFSLYPAYIDWQEDVEKLEKVRTKKETRSQYFAELKKIDEKLDNYKEGINKTETAIPASFSAPKIYNYLQQEAAQNELLVQEISLKKIKEKEKESEKNSSDMKENIINVNLAGSYSNFKKFIKELENSVRLFSIEGVSIEAPKELKKEKEEETSDKEQIFAFSIQLKVYSY